MVYNRVSASIVSASIASATSFAMFVVLGVWVKNQRKQRERNTSSGWSELTRTRTVKPPFPESVIRLLETTKLAYLATATDTENPAALQPHLCLMNFTYYKEGQQLIMTTRLDTKKADNLRKNGNVSVLIHDFPTLKSSASSSGNDDGNDKFGETYSITLTGVATILSNGSEESEMLRELHIQNNPTSATFIRGEGIGVVVIDVQEARICDILDKVTMWKAGG